MKDSVPSLLVVPQLDGWEERWDELVDLSPLPSPFLRSWWLTATGGSRRAFLLVVHDDRLLGGLALEERRGMGLQSLRMMGSGPLCPDHVDLIAAPNEQDTALRLIGSWLCRPGARLVDLEGVPAGSRLIEALPGTVRCEPMAGAPWTPLPHDATAYMAGLSSPFRRQVRRASARLAVEGATHRTNRGESAVRSLDTLRRLHQTQWGGRSQFLPEFDRFAAGCRLGAVADEVAVHQLANDEIVMSTVVTFEVAGRVSLYQSGRLTDHRWREATTVLMTAIITDACDRGFTEVDFLRGDEPYKKRFAPKRRELVRLIAANGELGRTALLAKAAAFTTKLAAERSVRAGRAAWARARPSRSG